MENVYIWLLADNTEYGRGTMEEFRFWRKQSTKGKTAKLGRPIETKTA